MKNKIIIVFSSHLGNEKNDEFKNHIKKTINTKHEIFCYENNNEYSLSEIYNKALEEHKEDNAVIVFCHPDIIIKTLNWGKILLNHFNNTDYSIIGVAGSTYIPKSGMWWEDRSKMYGIVEHTDGLDSWVSEYSNPFNGVKSTVNIDGLFMAVDPEKTICKFNENYGKFHFYDLTYSVSNYNEGVNVGVITSIRILHKSIGKTNQDWEENRQKFVKEYNLPIKHVSENKLRVLICCQFFKNYTGSEVSNYELSRELVKQGCDVTVISTVVGEPLSSKAKKSGVKVFSITNAPNYALDKDNNFQFIKNEKEFDVIHINHKPIGELILKLYPNTPAIMHIRSEVIPVFEEPIINPNIKRYVSIRQSITDYIKSFGIEEDKIIEIDNPFDCERFNINYKKIKNSKKIVLFIGTLDYLRKKILQDLNKMTFENNQELWVIGADNEGYSNEFSSKPHIKYFGVKATVEDYIKDCDYTAGIFKGRTTIEGFLCGKPGWIYTVDKEGNILNKELQQVPEDVEKYRSDYSTKKIINLYNEVISEMWL
jgi:glycosyltransferase involved in cell wall biosynthesis